MIVLDTDHASELGYRSAAGLRLLTRLAASGEETVITAITVEEQLRGRLAEIRRRNDPHAQVVAYERLVRLSNCTPRGLFCPGMPMRWSDSSAFAVKVFAWAPKI